MNFLHGLHGPIENSPGQTKLPRPPGWHDHLYPIIMRIKLVIFLITVTCMHIYATGRAQGINLQVKNATLLSVFNQLEKQSSYGFFYRTEDLKAAARVTASFSNASIKEIMDKVIQGQPLQYEIIENSVVIKAKAATTLPLKSTPQKKITGKVTDEKGQPLIGVTIHIKGTVRTVASDEKGYFSIDANEGQTLIANYLGYELKEIILGTQSNIAFSLKETVGQLQQVSIVNTGFQTLPKERATGSFATIGLQQLERQVTPDIISRLEGITSGLVFNSDRDGNRQIRVRGQNTIFANAEPLIVVDNFPYEGSLDNINPNDIESITVSKDAAAASIWGVRAGNGVIVITTKKGKLNQRLNVGLTSNVTIGDKQDIYYNRAFLNANDFINVEQQLFSTGFYTSQENAVAKTPLSPVVELLIKKRDNPSQSAIIDTQINALRSLDVRDEINRYFYQKSVQQQYAVNLNGGSDKVTYYLSTGADINKGNVIGQGYNRYTVNAQSSYQPLKNLTISTALNYTQSISRSDNILSQMPNMIDPYTMLADANGNPLPILKDYRTNYIEAAPGKGFLDWRFVPLEEIGRNTSYNRNTESRMMIAADYSIVKGLNAEIRYQYQQQLIDRKNLATADSYFSRYYINRYATVNTSGNVTLFNIPEGGMLTYGNFETTAHNLRAQLNYNRTFGAHTINALGGYEVREVLGDNLTGRFFGYDPDLATISKVNDGITYALQPNGSAGIPYNDVINKTTNRFISYYVNAAYTYLDRYTLSGSARVDGSNFFGVATNQKLVPLWSVGGKWDIQKETFYHLAWLPKLQLRTTYGFNGNLDRSLAAYTTIRYSSSAFYTGASNANVVNNPNPDLRWERTSQLNLGLDFSLKNNILFGSIDYYQKRGRDMIGDAVFAPSSGITTFRGNYAGTSGKGLELALGSTLSVRNFIWTGNILFNYATDRVTSYEIQPTNSILVNPESGVVTGIYPKGGYPIYGLFSYKWAGLSPVNGDPQGYLNGAASNNYTLLNSPANFDNIVYNGPGRPIYSGGFQNTFSYKEVSFSFTVNYKLGHYFRAPSILYNSIANSNGHVDFTQRWQQPGDESKTNVPSYITSASVARDTFYSNSEILVEKADHIRLQDINLSYNLSKQKLSNLPFEKIQLYLVARNVGLIWKANDKGIDPDYYRVGMLPEPRTIAMGFKANF